ncbi:MAG: DUF2797 domain-containing protein [Nitrospina sp.]|jgi:hypothetical protein|nr:DUF2797 domain-containing protein [Nitrospina sp.]MBT5631551.1 DUF2797 domain-containing protein [Nitrospina sp.]
MKLLGQLRKMNVEAHQPIAYFLNLDKKLYPMNSHIGKLIDLHWSGTITCIECGRKTRKSYDQGYCFVCSRDLPENAMCSVRPELCVHEKGSEADREFWRTHCNIDHFIYLSLTSGVKVGITRHTNIPDRWIDQGAVKGLIIAKVPERILSGQIEVILAEHFADKTNWRKMLKGGVEEVDLLSLRDKAHDLLPESLKKYVVKDATVQELVYPVHSVPEKITSHNLDKIPDFTDRLTGIKGQYLIFETRVINMRKYTGYHVEFNFH